jgi:hypothetical protein
MYGRLHLLAFGEQPNGSTDGQDTKPWWRHVKQGVLKLVHRSDVGASNCPFSSTKRNIYKKRSQLTSFCLTVQLLRRVRRVCLGLELSSPATIEKQMDRLHNDTVLFSTFESP